MTTGELVVFTLVLATTASGFWTSAVLDFQAGRVRMGWVSVAGGTALVAILLWVHLR